MSQRSHSEGLSARSCGHAGGLARFFAFSSVFLFALGLLHAQVPRGYWNDVRPVEGVNSSAIDYRPVISHNGWTLIFSSNRSGGLGSMDIYMATRDSLGEPFGNVNNLWNLNSSENDAGGCISADGLELFFFSSRGDPSVYDQDLYLATRVDPSASFTGFRYLDELNTTVHESYPWISADGQWLYFNRYLQGIMVAWREGPGQPFQEAKTVFESPFGEGAPSVSADGSVLFFSDTSDMDIRPGGYGCLDLWMVPLDAPDHSAGPEINLGSPPNGSSCEGYASISSDWPAEEAEIYFIQASRLDPSEDWNIYQATWHLADCDGDGIPDEDEIAAGTESDIDIDGVPDSCEPDCNSNRSPDDFDIERGSSPDCNSNGVPDECDIASGASYDCNSNGVPDECEASRFPERLAGNTTGIAEATFLGPPDNVHDGLGGQSVTYDFDPAQIADGPGADFNVYEGMQGTTEFTKIDVLVSADGVSFTSVKDTQVTLLRVRGDEGCTAMGLGKSYDLGPSGLTFARYIRIEGLPDEPAGEGRGFDLDAVGGHHIAVCPPPALPEFLRGNANADRTADISDAVFVLGYLFLGTEKPTCEKAADTNDDGKVDISDAVFHLSYLFLGSKPPSDPLGSCGTDPTEDGLSCESFPPCR